MKISLISACAAVMLITTGAAAEMECRAPYEPSIPERFETEDQLMATYGEVKDFVQTKSPDYLACLDAKRSAVDTSADDVKSQLAAIDQEHNDNVDSQNAVNNRFRAAHTIWKEENPS
jgi:hypothetical protein